MNSAATGVLLAAGAEQHLLDAVEDQRAVGQPGERVVGGEERELALARGELLVGSLALGLKGLAHAHERDVRLRCSIASARAKTRGRLRARGRGRAVPRRRHRASACSA